MSVLTTGAFWGAALERAVKTFAQTLIGVLTVGGLTPVDVDWPQALLAAGIAAAVSILTSVASAGVGDHAGPSLTTEELTPTPEAPTRTVADQ